MTLAIAEGHTVTIHYRLTLDDGTVAEDSHGGEPLIYQHGKRHIVPGLERGLAGRRVGDECEINVEPADGYGEFDPSVERSVPRTQFPAGVELQPGMSFQAQGPRGPIPVWVTKVESDSVTVSMNHPLAGQRLRFQLAVVDVRETAVDEQPASDSG
ncbi:MAG: peptidylprolyl isomerase [bacterium]|nr:peptidylprolyl isomerase [bacterium]